MTVDSSINAISKIKGIIFDCDGVLLNTRKASSCYINEHLVQLKKWPLPLENVKYDYLFSMTEEDLIKDLCPDVAIEEIKQVMSNVQYDQFVDLITPSDGMIDALLWLKSNRFFSGIMTNRGSNFSSLLKKFKFNELVDVIVTTEDVPPKPDPAGLLRIVNKWDLIPHRAIYVGDSRSDREAAINANIPFWSFNNNKLDTEVHLPDFDSLLNKLVECE